MPNLHNIVSTHAPVIETSGECLYWPHTTVLYMDLLYFSREVNSVSIVGTVLSGLNREVVSLREVNSVSIVGTVYTE